MSHIPKIEVSYLHFTTNKAIRSFRLDTRYILKGFLLWYILIFIVFFLLTELTYSSTDMADLEMVLNNEDALS